MLDREDQKALGGNKSTSSSGTNSGPKSSAGTNSGPKSSGSKMGSSSSQSGGVKGGTSGTKSSTGSNTGPKAGPGGAGGVRGSQTSKGGLSGGINAGAARAGPGGAGGVRTSSQRPSGGVVGTVTGRSDQRSLGVSAPGGFSVGGLRGPLGPSGERRMGPSSLDTMGMRDRQYSDPRMQATQRAIGRGWDPASARAMVGNFDVESGMNPYAAGDYDKKTGEYTALGLGQWRGDRLSALENEFGAFGNFVNGKPTTGPSLEAQVDFADRELRGKSGYKDVGAMKVGDSFIDTSTPRSVTQKTMDFARGFERPSTKALASSIGRRSATANQLASADWAGGGLPSAVASAAPKSTTKSQARYGEDPETSVAGTVTQDNPWEHASAIPSPSFDTSGTLRSRSPLAPGGLAPSMDMAGYQSPMTGLGGMPAPKDQARLTAEGPILASQGPGLLASPNVSVPGGLARTGTMVAGMPDIPASTGLPAAPFQSRVAGMPPTPRSTGLPAAPQPGFQSPVMSRPEIPGAGFQSRVAGMPQIPGATGFPAEDWAGTTVAGMPDLPAMKDMSRLPQETYDPNYDRPMPSYMSRQVTDPSMLNAMAGVVNSPAPGAMASLEEPEIVGQPEMLPDRQPTTPKADAGDFDYEAESAPATEEPALPETSFFDRMKTAVTELPGKMYQGVENLVRSDPNNPASAQLGGWSNPSSRPNELNDRGIVRGATTGSGFPMTVDGDYSSVAVASAPPPLPFAPYEESELERYWREAAPSILGDLLNGRGYGSIPAPGRIA